MQRTAIVITLLASIGAVSPVRGEEFSPEAGAQMAAIRAEKAKRTPVQRKLASQLLYLSREAAGTDAVAGAKDVKSRVQLETDGRVVVDMTAVPSPALARAIADVGGTVIYESADAGSVRASLPAKTLTVIASRADVKRIVKGTNPIAHQVTNESDAAEKANKARAAFGVNGKGVKVGVISDSAKYSTQSKAAGELPASFKVLPGRFGFGSGEGTAMSEIIHDIAPGAAIVFAEAGPGRSGFADSIKLLRKAGCRIIVDDISYSNEWQFQDDAIGKAVNNVVANGAIYLSACGNEGSLKEGNSTTWEGDFADGGEAGALYPVGRIHSFGINNYNTLTDGSSDAVFQWSDEYHSSSNDYDIYILNSAGTKIVDSSTDYQDGSQEPTEYVDYVARGERILIWKDTAAAPRYLRLSCTGSPLKYGTAGQVIGHAATGNCIGVAASDATLVAPGAFTKASKLEDYSSDGPHKMFYRPDGMPITPGNFLASGGLTINTPSITAGDGGRTSLTGFKHFYGTSAAAPAAAGIAALVWSKDPGLTNSEVRTILESSCLDIEAPGYDINSGYGILMADFALKNTLSSLDTWRKSNFGSYLPTGIASPAADPDGDGFDNATEFSMGTSPMKKNILPITTSP
ncbi:MAG: S8 family serine peptidase [Luteolibacter sp.]|uniref:S8 family serine peptidase n=1 Tax=Luteolibacter sp. TaxID=1962973 RepID=UPI00326549A0